MDHLKDKKRKLPRHVDGRIMVGLMPIKNFFLMLPAAIAIIVLTVLYFSPPVFFIGVLLLGLIIGLFSEFHQKETGFHILKDIIKYAIDGDKYFERNIKNVSFSKRFTKFEAKDKKERKG